MTKAYHFNSHFPYLIWLLSDSITIWLCSSLFQSHLFLTVQPLIFLSVLYVYYILYEYIIYIFTPTFPPHGICWCKVKILTKPNLAHTLVLSGPTCPICDFGVENAVLRPIFTGDFRNGPLSPEICTSAVLCIFLSY